eukprot:912781-Prorocentrum_minimum.AAC.1
MCAAGRLAEVYMWGGPLEDSEVAVIARGSERNRSIFRQRRFFGALEALLPLNRAPSRLPEHYRKGTDTKGHARKGTSRLAGKPRIFHLRGCDWPQAGTPTGRRIPSSHTTTSRRALA